MLQLQQSEATAARRRVPLHLVDATDGISPEPGEAAGQPQISKNGAAFGNTTATLSAIGNGAYYVELTAAELDTVGFIVIRYKSAATAEAQVMCQVVAFDPYDAIRQGMTALPNAAADAAGGLPISDAGGLDMDSIKTDTAAILVDTGTDGVVLAANAVSATAIATDAITAAKIANGAIDAATFAAGAIDATAIAADAIGSSELATTAVNEIRDAILADSTPFNGASIAAILTDTAEIGAAGAGLTAVPWNAAWDAEVESEVNDGLVALGLDHLVGAAVVGTDVTDNSIVARMVSKSATADWDSFVNTTDSLEAIADSGTTVTVGAMNANVVTASALATDAVNEIRDAILADSTAFNGADVAAILTDTAEIGAAGAGLTAVPWNAAWDAEVQSEVDDALVAQGLDHLVNAAVVGTDVTDNSIIAKMTSKSATADWDDFDNTTDSLQAAADNAFSATASLTEDYAADGAAFSMGQALYMIWSSLSEFAIAGTTITAKKLDGSTTAMTFTLDDATNPTSRTRAT